MKITVITSSPRQNGTSNFLAEEFIKGAKECGHEIYKFDAAKADVKNCVACQSCAMGTKPCVLKDDFVQLRENLLESDVIVFVTPVYYFGMTSSLKKVIDRFYSIDAKLRAKNNKAVLISSQHASAKSISDGLNLHYMSILSWLNIENAGIINALGIESIEQLKQTQYPHKAYKLGQKI